MAWTAVLLVFLSHGTSSLFQPVLIQSSSLSASPVTMARFTCTLSCGFSVSGHNIYWFQQKPWSPPQFLLFFYSDINKHQGSGDPSRSSDSKDSLANAELLLLSQLQPEDEADNYCATAHSSGSSYYSS
ncbi:unnamed protein product [Gulo gulo]|uniref:Ig-like domain-containing protein n=1 Tax=Gulo gulo TaxID=48420 RepID=A0A9X9LND1_GULGU|nr:unnamed protein product [Gulo gulo]